MGKEDFIPKMTRERLHKIETACNKIKETHKFDKFQCTLQNQNFDVEFFTRLALSLCHCKRCFCNENANLIMKFKERE